MWAKISTTKVLYNSTKLSIDKTSKENHNQTILFSRKIKPSK